MNPRHQKPLADADLDPPIPLKIMIERIKHHDDDRLEHELKISLAGLTKPLIHVDISALFDELPHIKEWFGNSENMLDLPMHLRDLFIIRCYELIASYMLDEGGVTAWWQMDDCRRWLDVQFLNEEVDALLSTLQPHVVPGVVVSQSVRCVYID